MKKFVILLGVIILLVFAISPASAIIDGDDDFEHTNVGAIVMYWPQFEAEGRLCTATLIDERVLVTAAHCYTYFENQGIGYDQIWITFDQYALADDAEYLDVIEFIPHPDFKVGGISSSDVALVILAEPIDIEFEQLPELGYLDDLLKDVNKKESQDLEFVIVGYGVGEEIFEPPDSGLDAFRRFGIVTLENLLAAEIKSTYSTAQGCLGDSGGPAFRVDEDDEVLVGVYSRGGPQYECEDNPMFHYRLDTTSAQKWINAEIAKYK